MNFKQKILAPAGLQIDTKYPFGRPTTMFYTTHRKASNKDRFEIIERGLDAYFQDDLLVFVHLIIPQIEEAIRNIFEYEGGNVLKQSKSGGYNLRTLDDILRDAVIKNAFGEDLSDYFKILFTDPRGWNLRNIVCHGMAPPNMFNHQNADRILHSLICLGLIHKSNEV